MKSKRNTGDIRWMFAATKRFHPMVVLLCAIAIFNTILSLTTAYFLQDLINAAVERDWPFLKRMILLMVSLTLLQLGTVAVYRLLREHTTNRIVQHLQARLFNNLLTKNYVRVAEKHSGEWMNRLILDIDGVAGALTSMLPGVVGAVLHLIGAGYLVCQVAPLFLLLAIIGAALLIGLNVVLKERLKQKQRDVRDAIGQKNVYFTEHLSKLLIVKAFDREQIIQENADEKLAFMTEKKQSKLRLAVLKDSLQNIAVKMAYLLVLLFCAMRIFRGEISYGASVMLMRLMTQIGTPITEISSHLSHLFDIIVSVERLREVEGYPDDPAVPVWDDQKIRDFYQNEFQEIRFTDAAFAYHDQKEDENGQIPTVFSHVNLSIPKHSCIAFTGITGSGKSTFFKLLMSFYDLNAGTKTVCTKAGEQIPLDASFRRLFAYVPQGNQLMVGTIREIVTFGDKTLAQQEDRIWAALETACAKGFVEKLPNGLDTVIREKGAGLSEGQLQRIAVARALLTERPVLLLDEATSALDEETEQVLLDHLKNMTDRTILFVTHRLNGLSICDLEVHINGNRTILRTLRGSNERIINE